MTIVSAAQKIGPKAISERHIGVSTPLPRYSGFPWWHALTTAPGHEEKSTKRLQQFAVHAYLPSYIENVRSRGKLHRGRLLAVVGGMLFVPVEMMTAISRRDELLDFCGVRIHKMGGSPVRIGKSVIERIREMEAELNLNLTARQIAAKSFKIGCEVKFTDDLLAEFWGKGSVIAIAKDGRITVEVQKLLGRATRIMVTAAKIEAMHPTTADKPPQVKAPHRS